MNIDRSPSVFRRADAAPAAEGPVGGAWQGFKNWSGRHPRLSRVVWFAVGLALLSAFLTFMVLTGLTPIQPTREVVVSFILINAAIRASISPHVL